MKKWTIMIATIVFTFSILNSQFSISSASALDSTPSADPLRPPSREAGQSDSEASIRSKLEDLKKEIASRAAKLKLEVNRKLKDKAYIGKIKTKSDSAITLATKNGPKIVNLNQDTEFGSNIKGRKYTQKSVSEEDDVASLGDVDEIGVLTARKIILLPTATSETKTFLWGQIISISDKLVTLKDRNLKNVAVSLPDSSTKVSDFIILTGFLGKNDIFKAEFVYVIPQGGFIKPKKIATSSATSKPTSH